MEYLPVTLVFLDAVDSTGAPEAFTVEDSENFIHKAWSTWILKRNLFIKFIIVFRFLCEEKFR